MTARTVHRLRAQGRAFFGKSLLRLEHAAAALRRGGAAGDRGRRSVLLSGIARSLNESIALITTENRLFVLRRGGRSHRREQEDAQGDRSCLADLSGRGVW
jgi:hypothetical protein